MWSWSVSARVVCVRVCTCQLVVQQQRGLSTQLPPYQAASLDGEGVVVSRLQAADAEVRLRGVAQEGRLVAHAVVHVHLVTLGNGNT